MLALTLGNYARAQELDDTTQASLDTVMAFMAFMGAMGAGEMEMMSALMADDMVWHNEGDKSLPWIGPWEGKETGEFTFALRAKERNGKVVLWHWFEDSFAVSQAYHG